MTLDDSYLTLKSESTGEFRDRGSRFIGYAFPVMHEIDFRERLQCLRKEHSRAVHHCSAFRLGADGSLFRSSDDREPSGTAGKPILGALLSKEITNAGIIVVRYFGGTLLGVPGLIHAYRAAALEALNAATIVKAFVEAKMQIQFQYDLLNEVFQLLRQFECRIEKQEQGNECTITFHLLKSKMDEFIAVHGRHPRLSQRSRLI